VKVRVAGGAGPDVPLGSAELYDPASGTWSATGSLATGRYNHTETLLPNGKVLVAGGFAHAAGAAGYLASAELYLPAKAVPGGATAIVADFNNDSHPDFVLRNARTRQTAVWFLNNNVFVTGAFGPTLPVGWGLSGAAD